MSSSGTTSATARSSRRRLALPAVRDSSVREARRREPAVVCQQPSVVRSPQSGRSPAVTATWSRRPSEPWQSDGQLPPGSGDSVVAETSYGHRGRCQNAVVRFAAPTLPGGRASHGTASHERPTLRHAACTDRSGFGWSIDSHVRHRLRRDRRGPGRPLRVIVDHNAESTTTCGAEACKRSREALYVSVCLT